MVLRCMILAAITWGVAAVNRTDADAVIPLTGLKVYVKHFFRRLFLVQKNNCCTVSGLYVYSMHYFTLYEKYDSYPV